MMTKHSLSERPVYGRTFHTIMWVVALLALIQLFAISLALIKRGPSNSSLTRSGTDLGTPVVPVEITSPESASAESPLVAPGPPRPERQRDQVEPQAAGGNTTVPDPAISPLPPQTGVPAPPVLVETPPVPLLPEPSFVGPAGADVPLSLSEALDQAARDNPLTGEPILERLLATGAELRVSGNMQGALQAFREVESALPSHPRVLSELAATLKQMGLEDKAGAYWERVEALGPVAASSYYTLAGRQLRGEPLITPAPPSPTAKILRIGAVKVEEQTPSSEGQKVSVRVVVETDPGVSPVGEDLALLVYFYDQVAGGAVLPSTADTSYLYPTEPYDWKIDGREEIIVTYYQPVFTDDQKRDLGARSYYGYAIELYYRDQIQDKVVKPDDIAKLRVEPPAEPDKDEAIIGPENALFPKPIIP